MSLINNCKFWAKHNDNLNVEIPAAGVSGVWSGGAAYAACKFGDGIYSAGSHVEYSGLPFSAVNKFTNTIIEFYFKSDYGCSNGQSDTNLQGLFYMRGRNSYNCIQVFIDKNQLAGPGTVLSSNWWALEWINSDPNFSWSAGDIVYLVLVLNKDGIDGSSDTARWYISVNNGTVLLAGSTTMAMSDVEDSDGGIIQFGTTRGYNDVLEIASLMGCLDNPKIYDDSDIYAAVIANRNNEGFFAPIPPTGLIASQGSYSNKISLSWDASLTATGYQLFRSTSPSGPFITPLIDQPGITYDDIAVFPGTTYYYTVLAYNGGGSSAQSSVVSGFRSSIPSFTQVSKIQRLSYSYAEKSDFDMFFFYGQSDLSFETQSDILSGMLQPKRSMYYNRSDGAGVANRENYPNSLVLNVTLRADIVRWCALRNTRVSDGSNNTPDRRVAMSQNFITFDSDQSGNLDIHVVYIPLADYKNTKTINIPVGGV